MSSAAFRGLVIPSLYFAASHEKKFPVILTALVDFVISIF